MQRAFYSDTITGFLDKSEIEILGALAQSNEFGLETTQRDAWLDEIQILQRILLPYRDRGSIYLEFSIPRLGKRVDAIVVIGPVIFVLEFKVGEDEFKSHALDQVWDYALDLKNFHETSHHCSIAPILIATKAVTKFCQTDITMMKDRILMPIRSNVETLSHVIDGALQFVEGPAIDVVHWENGRYCPTPTIVEAALALYNKHSVTEISRSDATAINLSQTSESVSEIIRLSKEKSHKSICFVTGVPGAGKTLVGLNIATTHIDKDADLYSVFLSGNGPLVAILREALARNKFERAKQSKKKIKKGAARREVKTFIQNIHHFRDECLKDPTRAPTEHVALFDEAQRAWNLKRTSDFMRRKKKQPNFSQSEPEFLISCLNRHNDWAVIVCLVGGGQEINTGEAGISEWIDALIRSFPKWHIYISSRLTESEYGAGSALQRIESRENVTTRDELHLSVSMRSFRAERVSLWVKQILDLNEEEARSTLKQIIDRYPIVITRNLFKAKQWLLDQARGSERYGVVASSEAARLKPLTIDVKSSTDPVHWFLDGKDDVRSSYYLEDVATQFDVQGLELDWACVAWDGDFRYTKTGWEYWSFCGANWSRMKSPDRKAYLKNAYRVLLTRARQGMVIFIPNGEETDPTRAAEYYNQTFEYLQRIGLAAI